MISLRAGVSAQFNEIVAGGWLRLSQCKHSWLKLVLRKLRLHDVESLPNLTDRRFGFYCRSFTGWKQGRLEREAVLVKTSIIGLQQKWQHVNLVKILPQRKFHLFLAWVISCNWHSMNAQAFYARSINHTAYCWPRLWSSSYLRRLSVNIVQSSVINKCMLWQKSCILPWSLGTWSSQRRM